MNGFIRKATLGACLGASISAIAGCVPAYRECVDPCWPERYNHMARHSVRDTFNAQAANGHTLDQVIWNQHFVPGSAKLTRQGEEHLKYIVRRMPAPDPRVFVQISYDAPGDVKDLNDRRVESVQDYLGKIAAYRNMPLTFEVIAGDFPEPGMRSRSAPNLYITPTGAVQGLTGLTPTTGTMTSQTVQQQRVIQQQDRLGNQPLTTPEIEVR